MTGNIRQYDNIQVKSKLCSFKTGCGWLIGKPGISGWLHHNIVKGDESVLWWNRREVRELNIRGRNGYIDVIIITPPVTRIGSQVPKFRIM